MVISNAGKKALTLISCGSVYSNESFSCAERTLCLSNIEFQYMGYSDVRGICTEGMAKKEEVKQSNLNKSIRHVRAIAREWYKKDDGYDSLCVNVSSRKRRFDGLI